ARHEPNAERVCIGMAAAFAGAWFALRTVPDFFKRTPLSRVVGQLGLVLIASIAVVWLNRYGLIAVERSAADGGGFVQERLAYPWYVPIGSAVAFVFGIALISRRADGKGG